MSENANLTYNDFSAGYTAGNGDLSSSLCAEDNIYLDLR